MRVPDTDRAIEELRYMRVEIGSKDSVARHQTMAQLFLMADEISERS